MKGILYFLFAALLLTVLTAKADVDCAGETERDHTQVTVHITNAGRIGATQSGLVHIVFANGGIHDYLILREDISQFFEGLRGTQNEQVMVGLEAYNNLNNPISINYVGTNYDKEPLSAVLREPARTKQPGNRMIVWRGPGFKSNEQFYFEDVVCSVVINQ